MHEIGPLLRFRQYFDRSVSLRKGRNPELDGYFISFYMGSEEFGQIIRLALEKGCELVWEEQEGAHTRLCRSAEAGSFPGDTLKAWFYLPGAGPFDTSVKEHECGTRETVDPFSDTSNAMIEVILTQREDEKRLLTKGRLYISSGYLTENGRYVFRPRKVVKVYNELARAVMRLAPLSDICRVQQLEGDRPFEMTSRERVYISSRYKKLAEQGYELR